MDNMKRKYLENLFCSLIDSLTWVKAIQTYAFLTDEEEIAYYKEIEETLKQLTIKSFGFPKKNS